MIDGVAKKLLVVSCNAVMIEEMPAPHNSLLPQKNIDKGKGQHLSYG